MLQTRTNNVRQSLLFHSNYGKRKGRQFHIVPTLPLLFILHKYHFNAQPKFYKQWNLIFNNKTNVMRVRHKHRKTLRVLLFKILFTCQRHCF